MGARRHVVALGIATAALVQLADTPVARACGCLSPPAVAVNASDYAINQSSEQIIFEVTPGWVTADVLIRYAGNPAQFAWLVPVPEAPDLSISPVSTFGLLDQATAPDVTSTIDDLCPVSEWQCHYNYPDQSPGFACGGANSATSFGGVADGDAGAAGADAAGGGSPVTVINQQVVGDYQTVTFAASDAAAATQWLQDNGFIVNPTTSIYMESYIQANMVFVAAKLVPGAGTSAIKPLRMKYRAAYPSIPLILTAVAAQPNLTVTAFVFGDQPFTPMGHPVVTISPDRLATDPAGRFNYPMVLARTIDEAGGDGFAIEYRGNPAPSTIGIGPCCGGGTYDLCNIGHDNKCECPRDAFDQADCESQGDLVDGVALLDTLGTTYTSLTRITTRISPEEMTFDPTFQPDYSALPTGPMSVHGSQPSLAQCSDAVRDPATYAQIEARQGCAAMYCGPQGQCVTTAAGPACACNAGTVAQQFIDLDEQPSVTCVPSTPTVDLSAGGNVLPDACAAISCGSGQCVDRNGIAVCACDANAAAVVVGPSAAAPLCVPIQLTTQSPGAEDYSEPLRSLAVCAPTPSSCGDYGWLQNDGTSRPGVDCGNATPPDWMTQPPASSGLGCGCQQTSDTSPFAFAAGAGIVLAWISRRRRRPAR